MKKYGPCSFFNTLFWINACMVWVSCQSSQGKFDAITGTWVMKTPDMTVGETWKKQAPDEYHGTSFIVSGADTSIYETVVLAKKDSAWYYTVKAAGQNQEQPIAFQLTYAENNSYRFENPAHDFPKRIIYRFIGKDSIHASIDGGSEKRNESHFYFSRQSND